MAVKVTAPATEQVLELAQPLGRPSAQAQPLPGAAHVGSLLVEIRVRTGDHSVLLKSPAMLARVPRPQ